MQNKHKAILFGIAGVIIFTAGAMARPAIDLGIDLAGTFGEREVYKAPPSEYETLVTALWQSERHQATCKANAAASVSLGLAQKYLKEYEKQEVLSLYDTPATEAVSKAGAKM